MILQVEWRPYLKAYLLFIFMIVSFNIFLGVKVLVGTSQQGEGNNLKY